ncbi:MAG: hypothetical protein H6738_18645 [Alphaproteobacteria bacterium]|nr:hypothetical protein [Alphaproteobacteria bacterium]
MRRILPPILLALAGCDDIELPACPPGHVDSLGGCVFDEATAIDLVTTFDQGDLEKINGEPFLQIVSATVPIERNVWVTPTPVVVEDDTLELTAADLYRQIDPDHLAPLDGDFPVGTVIVHEAVNREEGHAVQIRLADDYDDGFGRHWWFAKVFDDGTLDENPCNPCSDCHNSAVRPESDGLWGVPPDLR